MPLAPQQPSLPHPQSHSARGMGRAAISQRIRLLVAALFAGVLSFTPAIYAQEQSRGLQVKQAAGQSVETLLEAGDKLADAERWQEAVKVYRLATELDSKDAVARLRLAEALMSAGRWEEALDSYRRAVALDARNAEAHYALGRAFNDMGQHGDAFKPLVRAIQLDPSFAEAHHGIGWAYLRTDQFDKSLPFLRSALRLKPDYDEAVYALALAYYRLGQRTAADEQRRQLAALNSSLLKELDGEVARLTREAAAQSSQPQRPAQTDAPPRTATASATPGAKGRRTAQRRRATNADPGRAARPDSAAAASQPRTSENAAFELAFWNTIKDSTDPEDFRDYLRRYPDGTFADLARRRVSTRAQSAARPIPAPTDASAAAQPDEGAPQHTAAPDATQQKAPAQSGAGQSTGLQQAVSANSPTSVTAPATEPSPASNEKRADTPSAANAQPTAAVAKPVAAQASQPASQEASAAERPAPTTEAAEAAAPAAESAPASPARPAYDDTITRAEAAWSARDAAEAVRLLGLAAALAPERPEAFQILGVVELYGRQDLFAASRAMRAAVERGGTAAFAVTHDHDGAFGSYCQGSLYITRSGISYQASEGNHAFQTAAADIVEAAPHAAPSEESSFFRLRLKGAGGTAAQTYLFAPGTSKAEETSLILSLIPKP
jgi:Flp pilus assembly protein TadD